MTKLRHTPDGDYLPGMGRHWLMPLYDPFSLLLGAGRLHRALLDAAGIRAGQRVLEIGCGTGNLLTALARRTSGVDAGGIDPDRSALRRARRKAQRGGLPVRYEYAFAAALPLPDAHIDVALSSLMLHHLDGPGRDRALREVRRVLAPGGRLHVLDFDTGDLTASVFTAAGFAAVTETGRGRLHRLRYVTLRADRDPPAAPAPGGRA
ncbi:class I SAM-dependent methyltransferase [Actinoplanes philippinensis]|uniref:class I SAM-dependent methyltransferase n=1 Tax=Actinoplanes philippinensis TaxID=35752 RepID=UPI0033DB4217